MDWSPLLDINVLDVLRFAFVATVAATVTTAAIGIAIVSSKQQTNIAARKRNKRTKRLEHCRLEAPKKIQPTREPSPFESKNLPNKHFEQSIDRRSADSIRIDLH